MRCGRGSRKRLRLSYRHLVEATVGDHTMRLRPYETVRIEKGIVHSVRALEGEALVMSLSIPPLERDDQHAVE